MPSIFISIANYKDLETLNTVDQVIKNASGQHQLTCMVFSQLDLTDDRFQALDLIPGVIHQAVDYRLSQGVCWARAQIQKHYTGQDYYLQIDSHMLLDLNWDLTLIDQLNKAPVDKPVLSCYPMPYTIDEQGMRHVPVRSTCDFQIYLKDKVPYGGSGPVADSQIPIPSLFLAAGFIFAPGSWVTDVPYDPELFFIGEEVSLSIRSYCQGYRMFSPGCHVVAHLYNTGNVIRPIFWDLAEDHQRSILWYLRDETSLLKVKLICQGRWHGTYGITNLDSFSEYKAAVLEKHQVDITQVTI